VQVIRDDVGIETSRGTNRLKGQCHEMDILFEDLNILIKTSCVCADGFQLFTFYLLLKLLTNFEIAY
jgi:hypothetical protein